MTNLEIYNIATKLADAFSDTQQKFPVKMNFFLQKNKKTFIDLAREIEESRLLIARTYGTLTDEGNYNVTAENVATAKEELNELFNIEQDVHVAKISFDDLDPNMELTAAQMEALMFMIE